jgi:hypothetical protein
MKVFVGINYLRCLRHGEVMKVLFLIKELVDTMKIRHLNTFNEG